jgi:hypothetical protein
MNTAKLRDVTDYATGRLVEIGVDVRGLNSVTPRIEKVFDDYEKVVNRLVKTLQFGTVASIKKGAKTAADTKLMINGKIASVKGKTEYVEEVFEKYSALINELVAQAHMLVKNSGNTRSRNRNRNKFTRRRQYN